MKNIFLIILVCLCFFLFISLSLKQKALDRAVFDNDALSLDLKRTITLKGRTLIHKVRAASNGPADISEVKSESFYLPPEGSFSYKEAVDGVYKLDIKNYGFTFRPYIGGGYTMAGGFYPLAGIRLLYYGRYGLGALYLADNGFMIGAERRIDDLLPFDNMALLFGVNKNTAVIGVAVFL